jgi:glycosyltransferase involved in cell wall biosynthesis
MDLSIIIPFVGEYPQVLFTIQSVAQTLINDSIEFEIIAVDNWCETARQQSAHSARGALQKIIARQATGQEMGEEFIYELHRSIHPTYENRSGAAVEACAGKNPWLKYVKYEDRLSHWQAKRVGVEASTGDTLLFLDAHVVASDMGISDMLRQYNYNGFWEGDKTLSEMATLHMPLTYKILEWRRLIYKLVIEREAFYSYSFTGFRPSEEIYEVPCMSTCGMMISREIYDKIGGWPTGLGIYGGGENFMNFTLAVCGFKKYIYPSATLYHHGDKRDYHYVYDDMVTNRMIAHYLFGGEVGLQRFRDISKGRPEVLDRFMRGVMVEHYQQRQQIKAIQEMTIEEWASQWVEKPKEEKPEPVVENNGQPKPKIDL